MSLNYTVVINVRQRFGDNENLDFGLEQQAPFVGLEKNFEFECPCIDSSQTAILLYQSMGVSRADNVMEINQQTVFGGIPTSFDFSSVTFVDQVGDGILTSMQDILRATWNGNVMLISPNTLREQNVLHIRSAVNNDGDADNFIIDNLLVLYKQDQRVLNPGSVVSPNL